MKDRPSIVFFLIAATSFFAIPVFAHAAATAYFIMPTSSAAVGSALPVRVVLDSDQPLNAYSFDVHYSSNLSLQQTNNANSIITVWRDVPAVAQTGDVVMRGGSIDPFVGVGGEVLELDLVPSGPGPATISFANAVVYLANGKGTEVIPQTKTVSFVVTGTTSTAPVGPVVFPNSDGDNVPPSVEYLALVGDPFNPGQRLLAFSVEDTGSGVKEVDAQYRSGFFWSAWAPVKDPAPLPASAWEVNIRVSDNAGNLAMQTLYNWPALWIFIAELGTGLIMVVALYFLLK